jgi:hypothetical protein
MSDYISSLYDLPGFKHKYISGDLMHASDLGVCLIVIGNLLHCIFLRLGGLVTRPRTTLSHMMVLIKASARAIGLDTCPLSKLTMGKFKVQGKPPKFKGKAAQSRHLLPVLMHLLTHFLPPRDEQDEIMVCMLRHFCDMYKGLQEWTAADPRQLQVASSGKKMLLLFTELSMRALSAGDGLFCFFGVQHQNFICFSISWRCRFLLRAALVIAGVTSTNLPSGISSGPPVLVILRMYRKRASRSCALTPDFA